MELLRLLTLGRLGSGGASAARPTVTTTIATRVICQDLDEGGEDDDDGPFFELEFAVPLQGSKHSKQRRSSFDDDEAEGGGGCGSSRRRDHPALSFAPTGGGSKPPQVLPGFFLKFRVFKMVFHRRSRSASSSERTPAASPAATPKGNGFFVRFKMEEVPPASLFARDNSWRSSSSSSSSRSGRLYADDGSPASEERTLPRYLSKMKPLYVRIISKRHGDKLRFSEPLTSTREGAEAGGGDQPKEPPPASAARVVCRRLRKSRSASAAVASVRSPPMATRRQDDSLLEQQDGIQSAIAHCKRSFNRDTFKTTRKAISAPSELTALTMAGSTRGAETESPLLRSRSHPGDRIDDNGNNDKI